MSGMRWIRPGVLLVALLGTALLLWAASEGPRSPSWAANVAGAGQDWTSPTNVYTSNDVYAESFLDVSQYTDLLRATSFGFSIPSDATVDGIVVEIERKAAGLGTCRDKSVRIVKAGVEVGNDLASTSTWPSSDAYASYGSATNKWGTTWSPSQVNASNFGASVSAQEVGGVESNVPYIDHVRITVHYTPAAGAAKRRIIATTRRSSAVSTVEEEQP